MFLKCLENNPLLDPYTYCTLVAKAISLQLNNCTLPGRLTVLFVTISNQKLEGGKACLGMEGGKACLGMEGGKACLE